MRVLLLGATGNLGLRLTQALAAHGHIVTAYVRSIERLRGLLSPTLFRKISTYEGDALDSAAVEAALRQFNCDALVNTSGTRMPSGQEQILGKINSSVSTAAIRVGEDRGKPLRAWIIGGLGSLEYAGTGGYKIQDYMPAALTKHHRDTEEVIKAISTDYYAWTLLCVAMMNP